MRKNGTLYFLLSDHLGSTSLTADASGNVISELRYTAWGEVRYNSGVTPTQYQFTGQYSNVPDFGLLYYGARWYDPALARFAQADSIVPGGVQGYDRYAYANNAPTRYVDPTGHRPCSEQFGCAGGVESGGGWHRREKPAEDDSADLSKVYGPPAPATSTPTATPTPMPTSTPCPLVYPACLPTATSTATPYAGPTISSPNPPSPSLHINVDVYVDWTKVDGIDFAIDIAGLYGDVSTLFPNPSTPVIYGGSELAEAAGFVKGVVDLASGDPSNLIYQQTQSNLERTALMFFRGERLVPYVGFIGNLGSLYLTLDPEVTVNISYK